MIKYWNCVCVLRLYLPVYNKSVSLPDLGSLLEDSSVYEDVDEKKKSGSSDSSTCLVDTTTGRGVENRSGLKGEWGSKA